MRLDQKDHNKNNYFYGLSNNQQMIGNEQFQCFNEIWLFCRKNYGIGSDLELRQ
jgi:hypothetical protein